MLGLIIRTIKYKNPVTLLNLYTSPYSHATSSSVVWNPHYPTCVDLVRLLPDVRACQPKEVD